MTEQELQSIINAVLSAIRTNSRSIGQLTAVLSLSDNDYFEVAGGKKVAYSVLRDLISAAANVDSESIQADIAKTVLQSVSFAVTSTTATLSIKQQGYDAKTVSVPVATDSQSGIITATDKVKLDSAYTTAQSAANSAMNAATAAANAVIDTLTFTAGTSNVTVSIKQHGFTAVVGTIPAATTSSAGVMTADDKTMLEDHEERLDSLEGEIGEEGGIATLDENGQIPKSQLPDLDELNDTLEFSALLDSATVTSGTSEKKSTDSDAQVFYVTALKQFVLGVRTGVAYTDIVADAMPRSGGVVSSRLTDAQIRDAIALSAFPTLYDFYLDWADRELYSNSSYVPHSGKTFICTSTDTSYYWKSSVPALQPMGKDFTDDIQAVQDAVADVEDDVADINDALSYRLHLNGNKLLNLVNSAVSLDTFLTNTSGSAWSGIRVRGVVVTLYTSNGLES